MIVAIAVDPSDNAEKAFDFYVDRWHKSENLVVLVHALEANYASSGTVPATPAAMSSAFGKAEEEEKKLQQKYEKKLLVNKIQGKWVSAYEPHKPGHTIVEKAKEHEAQLIVIGSRGLGTIRRTFLGSVSDYVMHHSNVPVAVCPKQKK